jgi:hypothetical protein
MKYRVHRLEADRETIREDLENFLNQQKGEIITVLPYVRPAFQLMGATSKVGFLLVVEKIK